MISGNNGILTKTTDAKKANEEGIREDTKRLLAQEAIIEQYAGSTLSADEIKTKTSSKITGATEGVISEIKEFTENNETKYLPIPKGMAYLEGTIDTGAVVVDTKGNEFVWVPIVSGAETTVTSVWSAPGSVDLDGTNAPEMTEQFLENEFNKMKTSVETYGGFYVGRYETSWTGTEVASVGNVDSMNGSTQVNNADSNWYTFYTESKKLHNDSVVSSMIYNSQWNAIMKWMDDVINTNVSSTTKYIEDSTGMGNYGGEIEKTGSNDNYKVKNIYDLAGNMFEWTQKSFVSGNRVLRGGDYYSSGSFCPASYIFSYGDPTITYDIDGSRLTLYIK